MTPLYTANQRGWGLRLDEDVRNGGFIIAYVGAILDREALYKRLEQKESTGNAEYYIMAMSDHYFIDSEHSGNLARFINSSCTPNCESKK